MKYVKWFPIFVLAFMLMACSLSVNVPSIRTGVTQTQEIDEKVIAESPVNKISIEMGAGSLNLTGGAIALIEGTVRYNIKDWNPSITRTADTVTLSQKNSSTIGIPDSTILNEWDLKIGPTPVDLSLSAGAYEGNLDLSGLSITNLSISDGASKSTVQFNSPNPVEMARLIYNTGASEISLIGLGNANVREIAFDGGVGKYTIDFSGDLKKELTMNLNAGMSDITLSIPKNARALVTIAGGLNNVDARGTWTISGSTYECGTSGPLITINIDMAVGNLKLEQK
ncbi:MAG: toast rack family protein [Chloroflexi bacterium]|nr:toast rack family protein [Chloroflexota bacterium]